MRQERWSVLWVTFFDCTYNKSVDKSLGLTHLLENYIGLERNERLMERAEVQLLTEALKTSYVEAANILPSR